VSEIGNFTVGNVSGTEHPVQKSTKMQQNGKKTVLII
jgi:hypothetical protein